MDGRILRKILEIKILFSRIFRHRKKILLGDENYSLNSIYSIQGT